MSADPGRRTAIRQETADQAEASESMGLLRFDAPIEPTPSRPELAVRLNQKLTVRQKIARWLEEKL